MPDNNHHHKFDPSCKEMLDKPEYRRLHPEQVLDLLPLNPGDIIADIGAGSGFFTIPLAQRLPEGKVMAIDTAPEMLDYLQEKISRMRLNNIETALSREPDIPVSPRSMDGVLLFFVLHEVEDRNGFLPSVKSLLKPSGWVALMDWEVYAGASPLQGPPLTERVSREEARGLAVAAGFSLTAEKTISPDYYYFLLSG